MKIVEKGIVLRHGEVALPLGHRGRRGVWGGMRGCRKRAEVLDGGHLMVVQRSKRMHKTGFGCKWGETVGMERGRERGEREGRGGRQGVVRGAVTEG